MLRCDRSPVQRELRRAYAWLDEQMTARGLPGDGMLWLYARASPRAERWHAGLNAGAVLLTVEVAPDRVLLCDHGDWHGVLNDAPLVHTIPDEPWEEFYRRWEAVDAAGRAAVAATWQSVLDPERWLPDSEIVATVREIRAEGVVRAVRLRRSRFSFLTS